VFLGIILRDQLAVLLRVRGEGILSGGLAGRIGRNPRTHARTASHGLARLRARTHLRWHIREGVRLLALRRRRIVARAAATSALGLGSSLPHLRRDWAHPCHICTGTGPTAASSELGLWQVAPTGKDVGRLRLLCRRELSHARWTRRTTSTRTSSMQRGMRSSYPNRPPPHHHHHHIPLVPYRSLFRPPQSPNAAHAAGRALLLTRRDAGSDGIAPCRAFLCRRRRPLRRSRLLCFAFGRRSRCTTRRALCWAI
jgi:hypothetical protein